MGLKSYIRERIIGAVRYAVREEMNSQLSQMECNVEGKSLEGMKEEIVQRLDKQIERWTWERYQRTEKRFDVGNWEYYKKLQREIDLIETNIAYEIDKVSDKEAIIEGVGKRIVSNRKLVVEETERLIKKWTWERYLRIKEQEELLNYIQDGVADVCFELKKNKLHNDEKIRVVLLYQMPSMWPSWDSFYKACASDERFDIKVVFLNELIGGTARLENAEEYLQDRNIPYIKFEDFDIENYHPHVMFIQTPYDKSQRIKAHWSARFKSLGIRICYIPYGMEITNMPEVFDEQYNTDCLINCWRIYTFSESIKREYFKHSLNGGAVRALGLPKFDSLYHKEQFALDQEVLDKAAGKKIILWKLHFPKAYKKNGIETLVTPDFGEYINFAKQLDDFQDAFFIFMPHPLFREKCGNEDRQKQAIELFEIIEKSTNVYIDTKEDYRNSLFNAEGIIIDRSAVMIEAGAVGVPVLFMSNPGFVEPKPDAITPLIESYYQGSSAEDMISFVDMCVKGEDLQKDLRDEAFKQCIPYFDGKCGERIKEDILNSLIAEG